MTELIKTTIILLGITFLAQFAPEKQPGAVVLVGGSHIPKPAVEWFKKQTTDGDYVVITRHPERQQYWEDALGKAKLVLPEEFKSLHGISGIIIGGGDQWDYLTNLNKDLIQKAHNHGIPIMGNSAGAMILGEYCFSAEKGTITSEEIKTCEEKICICKFLIIKWLRGFIVDTHFSERNRDERLKIFVQKSDAKFGLGIDEATALCINRSEVFVVGQGKVKFQSP